MKDTETVGAFIAVLMPARAAAGPGYAQDAQHGKAVFKDCATCHATDHVNRVGPGLKEVVGRKAGTVPGFRYSNAMKNSRIVWDTRTLDAYLELPHKVAQETVCPTRD
ncbi:c-type cytochrome [Bradyrhizobium sp. USDA 10063]